MTVREILFAFLLLFSCCTGIVHGEEYIVAKGETALQIAIDHNLTMEQLQQLNPGADLEMMQIGDKLIVPDEDTPNFDDFLNKRYSELIQITDQNCSQSSGLNTICLFHLENLSDQSLFDVHFTGNARGTAGNAAQAEGTIPLMQILPGEKLPVFLAIPERISDPGAISLKVSNLTYSDLAQESFRVAENLCTAKTEFSPDEIAAKETILFTEASVSTLTGKKINVLASAYNTNGQLVGVRSLYSDFYPQLHLTVYSIGPSITKIDVRIEAY